MIRSLNPIQEALRRRHADRESVHKEIRFGHSRINSRIYRDLAKRVNPNQCTIQHYFFRAGLTNWKDSMQLGE